MALVVVGLRVGYAPAGLLLVGFAVYTPLERRWRRHDQPVRRAGLRTDIAHLLLTGALTTAASVVPLVLAFVLTRPLPTLEPAIRGWPPVLQFAGAFVTLELFGYWVHRAQHRIAFLWRFHKVHHSSERLDWIAGARNHPLDTALGLSIVIVPAVLVGFRPDMLGAFVAVRGLWAVLLHANVRWRLAWMDGWFANPEFHHWHHSAHPEAFDTNFAGFLPAWDVVFGTYRVPKDARPTRYGLGESLPLSWWAHMRAPFRRTVRSF